MGLGLEFLTEQPKKNSSFLEYFLVLWRGPAFRLLKMYSFLNKLFCRFYYNVVSSLNYFLS
jgi:hypothetical protein